MNCTCTLYCKLECILIFNASGGCHGTSIWFMETHTVIKVQVVSNWCLICIISFWSFWWEDVLTVIGNHDLLSDDIHAHQLHCKIRVERFLRWYLYNLTCMENFIQQIEIWSITIMRGLVKKFYLLPCNLFVAVVVVVVVNGSVFKIGIERENV